MGKTKNHDFIETSSCQTQTETKAKKNKNGPTNQLNLLSLTMLGLSGAIGSGIFVASGLAIITALSICKSQLFLR